MRLIAGCGYLGARVAALWIAAGHRVAAITRSAGRARQLQELGITPLIADVTDPQSLVKIVELGPLEGVFYAVGLDRQSGQTMEQVYIGGLQNFLNAQKKFSHFPKFLFVSSSSVYAQVDGEWVDESSIQSAASGAGKTMRDAEATLKKIMPAAVILRFAGIYGPGRLLRQKAIEQAEPIPVDPDKWLNLVHVDDGAKLVDLAWDRAQPGGEYNIADSSPVLRGDYYRTLARLLHAPEPHFIAGEMGKRGGPDSAHRRICAKKARTEFGWFCEYPNHELGLKAILEAERRQ